MKSVYIKREKIINDKLKRNSITNYDWNFTSLKFKKKANLFTYIDTIIKIYGYMKTHTHTHTHTHTCLGGLR